MARISSGMRDGSSKMVLISFASFTFHRAHRVGLVHQNDVDVGDAEPQKARFDTLDDVLARETALLRLCAPVDFRGDDVALTLPAVLLNDSTELLLRSKARVRLGQIKQIDTAIGCKLNDRLRLLVRHHRRENRPGAEAHI